MRLCRLVIPVRTPGLATLRDPAAMVLPIGALGKPIRPLCLRATGVGSCDPLADMTESSTNKPRRVLVTGASGFIGRGVVPALAAAGISVRAAVREFADLGPGVESAVVGDLRKPVNLSEAMRDVDAVVHLAGLAHQAPGIDEDSYREVNAAVTAALARAARASGVGRFVLLSSVRAQTGPASDRVVSEADEPRPTDAYGRSKLEAERLLLDAGLPHVVLRPVLVHGPGMRFNMKALLDLARRPVPLPLGLFNAQRSVLARDHLADAVLVALSEPRAVGGTFLVADPEPLTVADMVRAMRRGLGRLPGLLPVPPGAVAVAARFAGRRDDIARIRQSLVVDPARLLAIGWKPRRPAFDALAETARLG